ncbi:flagellar type III secretion system protein FliR [Sporolactobacillus shoreicorticis]|uniref:Flagellar biosynthetic protein FliR n=1 Tax=Sporolactobacillus shoreicorticis TaxID=1923877 RepID=A0ABW5S853_9BACL|nr:flagellar biosynthetic protein FliR [Sporolactobacillus shoreicorticis]MCO7125982.1 flagellar type III secretion system protein FliR [Sporolactobacillus shoreicorticis]
MSLVNAIPLFLLILARMTSFIVTMPIFSYRTVPAPVKIGLAAALALLVDVTLLNSQSVPLDGRYVLLLMKEILVGLTMGFVAGIITYAVQLAGAFIDMQIGFAIANVISPESGVPTPLTGQFLYVLQLLFFLGVNAHHMLINGVLYSFQLIRVNELGVAFDSGSTAEFVARVTAQMFLISAQLAIPVVGCLFLVDVAVGLVARTVPQINVFVVGLPLKLLVGFAVMLVVFPSLIGLFQIIFESMTSIFSDFMRLLGS